MSSPGWQPPHQLQQQRQQQQQPPQQHQPPPPPPLLLKLAHCLEAPELGELLRWEPLLPPAAAAAAGPREGGRAAVAISDTAEFARRVLPFFELPTFASFAKELHAFGFRRVPEQARYRRDIRQISGRYRRDIGEMSSRVRRRSGILTLTLTLTPTRVHRHSRAAY
jgi:hypothetical protein